MTRINTDGQLRRRRGLMFSDHKTVSYIYTEKDTAELVGDVYKVKFGWRCSFDPERTDFVGWAPTRNLAELLASFIIKRKGR